MATPKKGKMHGGSIGGTDVPLPVTPLLSKVAIVIGTDWKRLGRGMGLEDYEVDSIEKDYNYGGVYEMAYQMLRRWRQKLGEKADVRALEEHLEAIGRSDIAGIVSKTSTPTLCGDITSEKVCTGKHTVGPDSDLLSEVRDILMEEYQQIEVTGLPWMTGLAFTLDEYYVDLSLIKVDKRGRKLNSRSIIIEDLFNPIRSTKKLSRILVDGDPGMGKSTFAAKIAHDWAKQKNYVKHFDLVVLISLRHFVGELKSVICSALNVKESDYPHILKVFEDSSKQVLFVMDGYDEVSPEMETVILPMLRQDVFCHATVIVTSRPGKFPIHSEETEETRRQTNVDYLTTGSHFIQKRVKIKGFTKEQQITFVNRHTQNFSEEKVQSINLKLDTMMDKDFLKCPLFLLMLIVALSEIDERISFLETKTALYKQLFNFVIRRYWSRKNHAAVSEIDLFSHTSMSDPNSPRILPMLQFVGFSLWALSSHRVSFRHDEIMNMCCGNPLFLELGFLTQSVILQMSSEKSVVYEPVHKSLLEFAFAYGAVVGAGIEIQWCGILVLEDEGIDDRVHTYFFQQMSNNSNIYQFYAEMWFKSDKYKNYPTFTQWTIKFANMLRSLNNRAFDACIKNIKNIMNK